MVLIANSKTPNHVFYSKTDLLTFIEYHIQFPDYLYKFRRNYPNRVTFSFGWNRMVRTPGRKARFADHLGERTVRIRKVESSILFVSTRKGREIIDFTAFLQLFEESAGPANQPFPVISQK